MLQAVWTIKLRANILLNKIKLKSQVRQNREKIHRLSRKFTLKYIITQ